MSRASLSRRRRERVVDASSKKGTRSGRRATRSPRRKRSSVRFAPDASDFFRTRPYAHFGRVRRVWARSGVFRARDRRRRRGRRFSGTSIFFMWFFFFAARQHPVPAKPGSRSGRAVARSPPRANRPPTRERRDGTLVIPRFPPRSRARRGRGGRGATRPARDASANSANVSFSRSASGFFFATRFCFLHSQQTSSPLRALQTRESPRRRRSGRCGRMSSSSKR